MGVRTIWRKNKTYNNRKYHAKIVTLKPDKCNTIGDWSSIWRYDVMLHLGGFNERALTVNDTSKETSSAKRQSVEDHHLKRQHGFAPWLSTSQK